MLFNSPEVLPKFFESLAGQENVAFTLWVVDNSTDSRAFDVAQAECKRLELSSVVFVRNEQNVGVAAANNQGIRAAMNAGADHLILLNNDIEFDDPQLLAELLRIAESGGERVIVPKILYFDTRRVWYAGGRFRSWAGVNLHVGDGFADVPEYNVAAYTEYAPTCFLLVSREVFERVGLMDERYFVYYDDSDFAWRALRAGFRPRYEPRFTILHKVSTSTGGALTPFSIYYYTRNRFLFILKNIGWPLKAVTLSVFAASLLVQWRRYDAVMRKSLLKGFKDGLKFVGRAGVRDGTR